MATVMHGRTRHTSSHKKAKVSRNQWPGMHGRLRHGILAAGAKVDPWKHKGVAKGQQA